eukprot:14883-Eustigmatos_ZCMA.PRE.1
MEEITQLTGALTLLESQRKGYTAHFDEVNGNIYRVHAKDEEDQDLDDLSRLQDERSFVMAQLDTVN